MVVQVMVSGWMDAPVRLPPGQKEFAIGDVHGELTLFLPLLRALAEASAGAGHLTLLGDLADRGPRGAACWALAADGVPGFASQTNLLGNHEMIVIAFMNEGTWSRLDHWVINGGSSVLAEVGIDHHWAGAFPAEAAAKLREVLGPDIMRMLDGAVSHRRTGNLLFVHGGIDPAVPIEAWFEKPRIETDSENHWGWVRFPFFFHQGSFQEDVTVVHGHSPENMIGRLKDIPPERYHMLDGHRIGLDAGSFLTGRVAGAEFIDGRYRVYIAADSDRQQG